MSGKRKFDDGMVWESTGEDRKELARQSVKLMDLARERGAKISEGDEVRAKVACAKALAASKMEGDPKKIDAEKALASVLSIFGVTVQEEKKKKEIPEKAAIEVDDSGAEEGGDDGDEKSENKKKKKKAKKKTEERKKSDALVPANQPLHDAFAEIASHFFKLNEMQKGFTFRKVATAIAALEWEITGDRAPAKKGPDKIKGIGDKSVAYIKQYIETGTFDKLEEVRAESAAF